MHCFFSLSISLPSSSPLLNLSSHQFISKQQRIHRIFSFFHSIFIGIPLSLPSYQNAKLITTSKYQQPHHTLQLMFHSNETDRANHIQQLCNKVGIKCFMSSQSQPSSPPPPTRVVIDLEKIPDTLEDTFVQDQKTPSPTTSKSNRKRQRSPSPPLPTPSTSLDSSPPPSPKSYNLRTRKVVFQNFKLPQSPPKLSKPHQQAVINWNSPNLRQLPPPSPSHCLGDPVYPYEFQLPNYPSHWRFRIFYDPRGFFYYRSYGHIVDYKGHGARRVV